MEGLALLGKKTPNEFLKILTEVQCTMWLKRKWEKQESLSEARFLYTKIYCLCHLVNYTAYSLNKAKRPLLVSKSTAMLYE